MSITNSGSAIENVYIQFQKEIFSKLIWAHLFDDEIKYLEADIFEQSEKYIRVFFEEKGFEWNDENKKIIHELVLNSDNAKLIFDYFEQNYEKCLSTKLNWTPDSSAQRMIIQIIDASFENQTKLSYSYAKKLLVKYYYDKYFASSNRDKIISNLMTIFFTNKEIQWLVSESNDNLDSFINKSYYALDKVIGQKEKSQRIDPKFFIRKFVMNKHVHYSLYYNPNLKKQLLTSQYVPIYRDLLDEIDKKIEDIAQISNKKQEKQNCPKDDNNSSGNDSKLGRGGSQDISRNEPSKLPVTEPSRIERTLASPIDAFLAKIGKEKNGDADEVAELLMDSFDIIKTIEEHRNKDSIYEISYYGNEFNDEEIELLKY